MADITRGTTNVSLPLAVSNEIWQDAAAASVVMSQARKVTLPGSGMEIQVITGDPAAAFVNEGARKPATNASFDKKTMRPYKIAVVESFSTEFRRDKAALYNALRSRLSNSIASVFDAAVLHGVGAPVGMDNLSGAPTQAFNATGGYYPDVLAAAQTVANNGGDADTILVSPKAEFALLGDLDTTGRPLFVPSVNGGSIGTVLGRSVYKSKAVYKADTAGSTGGANAETLGFVADFSGDVWGTVEGIQYSESDNPVYASNGTLIHAGWQDNMFSILAEIEVGYVTAAVNRHVRLTGADV